MFISKPSLSEDLLPNADVMRTRAEQMEAAAQESRDRLFETTVREALCHLPPMAEQSTSHWIFETSDISGECVLLLIAHLKNLGYDVSSGSEHELVIKLPDELSENVTEDGWTAAITHQRSIDRIVQRRFVELTDDLRQHMSSNPREIFRASLQLDTLADQACRVWLRELAQLQSYSYRETLNQNRAFDIEFALSREGTYHPPIILEESELSVVELPLQPLFESLLSQVPWEFSQGQSTTSIKFDTKDHWSWTTITFAEQIFSERGYYVWREATVNPRELIISTAPKPDPLPPSQS